MATRIHLQFVMPHMRLARPLSDADGRLVAGVGTMLSPGVVRVLRHMAVQSVMVEEAGNPATWAQVLNAEEELAALAARFAGGAVTGPLAEIKAAIARRVERRAATITADGPDTERV